MKILEAFGDTPLARAARMHAAAERARNCCEEHARADAVLLMNIEAPGVGALGAAPGVQQGEGGSSPPPRSNLAAFALGALTVLALVGCANDPAAPTAAATPSPSPTLPPVASECVIETVLITAAIDEPGRRTTAVPAWGLGQIALLTARPVNRFLDVVRQECPHFSLVLAAPWSVRGAACFVQGPDQTSEVRLKCNQPGDVRVTATLHGSDDRGNRITKTGSSEFRVVGGESASRRAAVH